MPSTKKKVSTAGPRIDVNVRNLLCSLFHLNENPSLEEINALINKHGLDQTPQQIRKWFCNHRRAKPSKEERDRYERTRQANMSKEKRDEKRRYLRQYHANRKQGIKHSATPPQEPLNTIEKQGSQQHATPSSTAKTPPTVTATPQNPLLAADSEQVPPPPSCAYSDLQPMQLSFDDFDVDAFLDNFPW